ncbi:MAG: hypothetical protein R3B84_12340 [Zavarzinella sp.]
MNRRVLLQQLLAGAGVTAGLPGMLRGEEYLLAQPPRRKKQATKKLAILTTVYRYLSHSYHLGGRFLNGYWLNGKHHFPDFGVGSIYTEQRPENDLTKRICEQFGVFDAPTIPSALKQAEKKLAVEGIMLIGEHGNYPVNKKGQILYPRFEYFQEILKIFHETEQVVPVFVDKHLSYDRKRGFEMVAAARKMGFPLMAGSSLPVTYRRPELELELGTPMKEALVVSRSGVEIYGIHALEALQTMVERRFRGRAQQGVKSVQYLAGPEVWKAGDAGLWSWKLLDAALKRSPSRNNGDPRENCQHFRPGKLGDTDVQSPRAFLLEYRDGLKATVLQLDGHVSDETFAATIAGKDEPISTLFFLPPPPGAAFLEALGRKVEDFFNTGKPPYPVERTMLTGGILDWVLDARLQKKKLDTPDLDIEYQAPADSGFIRGSYELP